MKSVRRMCEKVNVGCINHDKLEFKVRGLGFRVRICAFVF